jgi:hypothetical protein
MCVCVRMCVCVCVCVCVPRSLYDARPAVLMGGKKNETPNAHEQRPAFAYDKIDLLTQTKSLTTTDNAGKRDVQTQAKETY